MAIRKIFAAFLAWVAPSQGDRFRIKRDPTLERFESIAENNFAEAIEDNLEDYVNSYRRRFGKTINTDQAKLLCKPYAKSKKEMTRLSRAVYAPAKALANELYRRDLESEFVERVIFMGGGTASGKSSNLKGVEDQLKKADVVIDSTMASLGTVRPQVIAALARNLEVEIIYVYCPLDVAISRAIVRADKMGRSLSLDVMTGTHFKSQRTLLALDDEFGENPGFAATVIDNSGDDRNDEAVAIDVGTEYIRERRYSNLDELKELALTKFHEASAQFQEKEGRELPAQIREAFLRPGRSVD